MRVLLAALAVAIALATAAVDTVTGASRFADRQWRSGTWRAPATPRPVSPRGGRPYAIEGDGSRYEVDEVVPLGGRPLAVTLGAPVRYAVEKFIVYVLDGRGVERTMQLVTEDSAGTATAG